MITIEGTVTDILGYPTLFFSRDARSPAVSAPINAAAAGGIFTRSTSSSLRVLAAAPIPAAADCQTNRAVKHDRESKHSAETCKKPE